MKQYRKRGNRRWWLWVLALILIVAAYISWALLRPIPTLKPVPAQKQFSVTAPASKLAWPAAGQSAVALLDEPVLETHGLQKPAPIASTAKVITALVVLNKKPLKPGQQGPVITLTAADVASYQRYAASDGSLVPVVAGEQISEYQMLQAIMLPSANNIADTMAIWAFGSLENYAAAANTYAAAHGLKDTHIGEDASGFSPTTTSTARDLAKLGALAMQEPVLAEIVGQPTATGIPQTTVVKNVNFLLGTDNIVGVKTGNTDQAGGVFISASKIKIGGQTRTIITAVAGSANLYAALKDSHTLVKSAQASFSPVTVVRKGDVVARYHQPWGNDLSAQASQSLTTYAWNGSSVSAEANLQPLKPNLGTPGPTGVITLKDSPKKQVAVVVNESTTKPTAWWRLAHPFPQ